MPQIQTYPAITNANLTTSDQLLVNDASGPDTTKNITYLEQDKRYAVTSGNSAITGNVTITGILNATTLEGNGAALTGITGATGGISNTGSTTIGADTDVNGSGIIDLQTRTVSRMTIVNDGKVGIGVTSPLALLHVNNDSTDQTVFTIENNDALANDEFARINFIALDSAANRETYVAITAKILDPTSTTEVGILKFEVRDGAGTPDAFVITGSKVGVNTISTPAQFSVDQASTSGAIPVMSLNQGDIDDSFIDFVGTSASDGSRSISSDTTEDSTKFGAYRIEINGVTKWVRIYDNES